jgi:hypothetical protein
VYSDIAINPHVFRSAACVKFLSLENNLSYAFVNESEEENGVPHLYEEIPKSDNIFPCLENLQEKLSDIAQFQKENELHFIDVAVFHFHLLAFLSIANRYFNLHRVSVPSELLGLMTQDTYYYDMFYDDLIEIAFDTNIILQSVVGEPPCSQIEPFALGDCNSPFVVSVRSTWGALQNL